MSAVAPLIQTVRDQVEGTPYVLTETPHGFDVQIDIQDMTWRQLYRQQHLARTWIYHVRLDEERRTASITDEVREVRWEAGAGSADGGPRPVLGASLSRSLGRIEAKSFQKSFGATPTGGVGETASFSFTASEGRELIRGPLRSQAWTEERGASEKAGIYVAIATLALLVVAGLAVGVVALAGGL